MTLPSSGPLSIGDIRGEFGGVDPLPLSDYYAGGPFVPAGTEGDNGPIPSAGEIKISDFYGSSNILPFTLVSVDLGGGLQFGYESGVGGSVTPPSLFGQTISVVANGSIALINVQILGNNLPQTFFTGFTAKTGEDEVLSADATIFDTNAARASWAFAFPGGIYLVDTYTIGFR